MLTSPHGYGSNDVVTLNEPNAGIPASSYFRKLVKSARGQESRTL